MDPILFEVNMESLRKRNKEGPVFVFFVGAVRKQLCIFFSCTYSQQIWRDLEGHLGLTNLWNMDTIEGCFSGWFSNTDLKPFQALPFLVLWGIWLAHNSILFEERFVPYFKTSAQVLGLLSYYKNDTIQNPPRLVGSSGWTSPGHGAFSMVHARILSVDVVLFYICLITISFISKKM
jgi:hypothetical protein